MEIDEQLSKCKFRSKLAPFLRAFFLDKIARGFLYKREVFHLRQLDRFLVRARLKETALSQSLVERWLSSTLHRRPSTHRKRVVVVRQLSAFLQLHGLHAYRPLLPLNPRKEHRSAARIFSRDEMRRILQAADRLQYAPRSPWRHIMMPEIFRILYGCGLRISEVLRLTVADVDLAKGVLIIRQGKFRRDRLVPLAPTLQRRLEKYGESLERQKPVDLFFPSPRGRQYNVASIYSVFRKLLRESGIAHGGRGRGPRLHEIRHTMAVHRLEAWYRAGDDVNAKLPLLATYLGHSTFVGTAAYLQLTQALFSDVAMRLEADVGYAIPDGIKQ